jgi:type IV secretion system protein TrbL
MKGRKGKVLRWKELPVRWVIVLAIAAAFLPSLSAQAVTSTTTNDVISQMRSFRGQWMTNIWTYARNLFWLLAFIEFAWSVIALALDKTDLQCWMAGLVRKLMWIGAFYALLQNGSTWIPAIIDSFELIGAGAAGMAGPLDPGSVFVQGLSIAGSLLGGASASAFMSGDIGSALICVLGALIIVVSFVIITINFVVTLVESYLVVSVGYLFLGFGGSRWTAPYTERYIGLAVSIGIKLVLLYCIIAAGSSLGAGWEAQAATIGTATSPAVVAFDVMGGSLIYMMLCWQIPKLFSSVLGGAPALTGGDLVAAGTAVVGAGLAAASLGAGAVAAAAGAGAAAGGPALGGTSAAAGAGAGGSSAASAVSAVSAGSGSAGGSSVLAGSSAATGGTVVAPPASSAAAAAGVSSGGTGGSAMASPPVRTGNETAALRTPGNGGSGTGENATSRSRDNGRIAIDGIGGQPVAGSGFEPERPTAGFTSSVASPSTSSSSQSHVVAPPTVRTAPRAEGGATVPAEAGPVRSSAGSAPDGGASAVSDISSVGTRPQPGVQPPVQRGNRLGGTAAKARDQLSHSSDAVRNVQLNDGALPASPPRMPIDDHE